MLLPPYSDLAKKNIHTPDKQDLHQHYSEELHHSNPWTGTEVTRRMRFQDIKTISRWSW